jgi:hypothetical protein
MEEQAGNMDSYTQVGKMLRLATVRIFEATLQKRNGIYEINSNYGIRRYLMFFSLYNDL